MHDATLISRARRGCADCCLMTSHPGQETRQKGTQRDATPSRKESTERAVVCLGRSALIQPGDKRNMSCNAVGQTQIKTVGRWYDIGGSAGGAVSCTQP